MFKDWNPVYSKKPSNSAVSLLEPAENSPVEVANCEEIPSAEPEPSQEQNEKRSPGAVNIPLPLHKPGARPFSLLCPGCGATDNFYFPALELVGNSGGELVIICGYCNNELKPGKHYAGTAREIYEKLTPAKEDPPGQDPARPVIKP